MEVQKPSHCQYCELQSAIVNDCRVARVVDTLKLRKWESQSIRWNLHKRTAVCKGQNLLRDEERKNLENHLISKIENRNSPTINNILGESSSAPVRLCARAYSRRVIPVCYLKRSWIVARISLFWSKFGVCALQIANLSNWGKWNVIEHEKRDCPIWDCKRKCSAEHSSASSKRREILAARDIENWKSHPWGKWRRGR